MVANVNDSEFKSNVLDSDGVVVVDFWAEWCGPCKALSPLLEQAASEVEGVKVVKMNVDENTDTPVQYGIRGIPTLIAFKGGEPVASLVGLREKAELVSWMESQK
ncbi:MAG: thioredoxin [Pseudomonas fluorescens]|nr:MAG: thioredoxin [Pseudomonas fluorescens]